MSKNNSDPQGFDANIRIIERDIYDFFVNGLITYSGRDPIFAKIITCFFTRQQVTQSQLKKLTGLSSGAISETLKRLLNMKIISKSSIGGKYHYKMDGISFGKSEYVENIEGNYHSIIGELRVIKEQLDTNEENWTKLEGFTEAKNLTQQLLAVLEKLIPSLTAFEQELARQLDQARKNKNILN